MKRITGILTILNILVFASFLTACGSGNSVPPERQAEQKKAPLVTSPVPVPANPAAYGQITAQASDHWREMAAYTAQRVYKAYEDREDLLELPIYVAPPNNRPFTVAYYNLLRTELVSRGLQVSYNKEPRSVVLEYSVQSVPFDAKRFEEAEKFSGQGSGSDHEIVVNSRLFYRNRFVMHCSSIRYINDADLPLYIDPQAGDPMAESSRSIRITRK